MRLTPLIVASMITTVLLGGCAVAAPRGGDDATPLVPSGSGVAPRDQSALPGSDDPIASPRDVRCSGGDDLTLDGQGRRFDVTGDCGAVTVRGQALTIEIESAGSLSVDGQAVQVEVDGDLDALQVSGDANSIEAGAIATIAVSGQGNAIEGGRLGALSINGDGNTVEGDSDPSPSSVNGQGNVVTRR